ncbi:CUE domain-containing protein 2-like [Mercenaria mercenaria]|uniref:CUE domain-containing protein 2-like n=1 Tax=Mercenaria mercenaria TaxID=6596 RepID=UPI00234F9AE9|nr:CUE domain-containing protein 2-like [Mercenaria mercenaria]XP_045196472.2 CUE domain-containing protein 2-like [Mercenaria mercenaria]XP_045196473.2 CUE domain-containing protein 2-like [Mercenaria mercenaria]
MASESENTVQTALAKFLRGHSLHDHVSDIDEIVLSYIISILEDLGDSENAEENIDVDQFVEMMDAYIPGFATIDSIKVCEWMFELASTLSRSQESESKEPTIPSLNTQLVEGACSLPYSAKHKTRLDSTGENERSSSESSADDIDEQLQQLIEMFPTTVRLELEHCLHSAEGDIEKAVQIVLHRQETDTAFTEDRKPKDKKTRMYGILDDKKLKDQMMERYAFIDVNEDKKQYKPTAPKSEPKKMIRYLDNQVVNTKGQRFTEVKKDDTEEMKKTYISLKPARKYRFH